MLKIKACIFFRPDGSYATKNGVPLEHFTLPSLNNTDMILTSKIGYWSLLPRDRARLGSETMVISEYTLAHLEELVLQIKDLASALELAKSKEAGALHVIGGFELIENMLGSKLIDELSIHLSTPLGDKRSQSNPSDKRCAWLADLKVVESWEYLYYAGMSEIGEINPKIVINTMVYRRKA